MHFLHSFYSVSIPSACDGFVGASFTAGYFTIAASKIVTSVNCRRQGMQEKEITLDSLVWRAIG